MRTIEAPCAPPTTGENVTWNVCEAQPPHHLPGNTVALAGETVKTAFDDVTEVITRSALRPWLQTVKLSTSDAPTGTVPKLNVVGLAEYKGGLPSGTQLPPTQTYPIAQLM
jgi:hypothetical protein